MDDPKGLEAFRFILGIATLSAFAGTILIIGGVQQGFSASLSIISGIVLVIAAVLLVLKFLQTIYNLESKRLANRALNRVFKTIGCSVCGH